MGKGALENAGRAVGERNRHLPGTYFKLLAARGSFGSRSNHDGCTPQGSSGHTGKAPIYRLCPGIPGVLHMPQLLLCHDVGASGTG